MRNKPLSIKLLSIICILTSFSGLLIAQNTISGQWGNDPDQRIILWMLRGDMRLPVDSARTGPTGQFSISPRWNVPPGFYLLEDEKGDMLRLIFGAGDVRLFKNDIVRFEASPNNQTWQEWQTIKENFIHKQDALEALIVHYPASEKFRKMALKEIYRQRQRFAKNTASLLRRPGSSVAARFIAFDVPPMLPPELSQDEKVEELKNYLRNLLSTTDTLLIQSDLLPGRLLDYLTLYQRRNMSRSEIEEAFKGAIDRLMQNASAQNRMYLFYLEYLFDGFQRLGFSLVTDFLSSLPYFNPEKATMEDLFEIERIIGPYHNILTGNVAPQLTGHDWKGNTFDINEMKSEKYLILFWSEDCPHCTKLLPELKPLLDLHPSVQTITIVLGNNTPSLAQTISNTGIKGWTHLIEPDGWKSKLMENFRVFGTPSMYLLDSEKRIIAQPNTLSDLKEALTKP